MPHVAGRIVRVLKLGAVAGVAVAVARALRGDRTRPVVGSASWPPLAATPPTPPRSGPVRFANVSTETTEAPPDDDAGWVPPVGGECPTSHPIKGNAQSGIYHVPGGLSYARTIPERCYATPEAAEADGFRRAKR